MIKSYKHKHYDDAYKHLHVLVLTLTHMHT